MKVSSHTHFVNAAAGRAGAPRQGACLLSVLVPVYNADPATLLRSLLRACIGVAAPVEILVADDGSDAGQALHGVIRQMRLADVPCGLLSWRPNRGRSATRNLLCRHADGTYVLYLDGDVAICGDRFLARYLALIRQHAPVMAVGGFCMGETPDGETASRLQRYVSRRLHSVPLPVRRRHPGRYVYASNLLVRRRRLLEQPFDERFEGWGWEDVELGFRFSRHGDVVHVDNPVVHQGLQCSRTLVERWEGSVSNFRLLCRTHPRQAAELPIYRASRAAAWLPAIATWRRVLRRMVLNESPWMPLAARYWGWKLLRAAIYAEALPASPQGHEHVLSQAR